MKKLAVIVGAGRGMGNNIAERFAKENFRVVLVARRQNFSAVLSCLWGDSFANRN